MKLGQGSRAIALGSLLSLGVTAVILLGATGAEHAVHHAPSQVGTVHVRSDDDWPRTTPTSSAESADDDWPTGGSQTTHTAGAALPAPARPLPA